MADILENLARGLLAHLGMPLRVQSTESLLFGLIVRLAPFCVAIALAVTLAIWVFGSLRSARSPGGEMTVAQITEEVPHVR